MAYFQTQKAVTNILEGSVSEFVVTEVTANYKLFGTVRGGAPFKS